MFYLHGYNQQPGNLGLFQMCLMQTVHVSDGPAQVRGGLSHGATTLQELCGVFSWYFYPINVFCVPIEEGYGAGTRWDGPVIS